MSVVDTKIFPDQVARHNPFDPSPSIPQTDVQAAIDQVQANVDAADAALKAPQYLVAASDATLANERVTTDTPTVSWDHATAGQAKANVPDDAVTDAKLRNSAALSVMGRAANSVGDPADIAAGANDRLLTRIADALGWTQLTAAMFPSTLLDTDATLAADSDTRIASQKAVKAYVGNAALAAVTTANAYTDAAISALRNGVSAAFDTLAEIATELALKAYASITITGTGNLTGGGSLAANRTLDMANMAQSTIKGRAAGAGTGTPTDLSATQATAILDAFVGDSGSGGAKGLVPAPASGDAAANKFLKADGSWAAGGGFTAANQTQQEAASSNAVGVTPGTQQYHPSAAKCWAYITVSGGVPTLAAGYNITSITDVGVGKVGITIATDFSSANWVAVCSSDGTGDVEYCTPSLLAAGHVELRVADAGSTTFEDPDAYFFAGFGDQ